MGLHILFGTSVLLLLSYSRGLQILQPQKSLKTEELKTVTLVCVLSGDQPLGPVRWYKEAGSTRTHLYSAVPTRGETNDPRVTWVYESTTVNFSILMKDVRVSDTGTYYCVKYRKGLEDHPVASGLGVSLTVAGRNLLAMKRNVRSAHPTTHESKTADDNAYPSMQYVHYNLRGVQNEPEREEEYEEPIFDSLEFRTLKKETDSLSSLDNIYANTVQE
uniref:Signal-regulatory protein beta-1-like n=1 Tax=Erpetoichthys calabaricus TaxID=27687 RepID=A0A8C4XA32_ERPCA